MTELNFNPSSSGRENKLIINTEPYEDADQIFLDRSLSEGYFSIDMLKKARRHTPKHSVNRLPGADDSPFPQSPTAKQILLESLKPNGIDLTDRANDTTPMATQRQRNFYSRLMQYFLIKKFVRRLSKTKILNSKFNAYHYNIINDKASTLNLKLFHDNSLRFRKIARSQTITQQITSNPGVKFSKIAIRIEQFMASIPLFEPDHKLKLTWDGIMVIIRIYFLIMIPLNLSYSTQQFMFVFMKIPTFLSILMVVSDFLISLNTAYYRQGLKVKDRMKITMNLISKNGSLDFVSFIMLVTNYIVSLSSGQQNPHIETTWYQLGMITFVVQFINVTKYLGQIEESLNFNKLVSSVLQLIKLILAILYMLHIFACLWFWVFQLLNKAGDYSQRVWGKSWLSVKSLEDSPWIESYLYSFYFSTVTMFTVGYGDISPSNDLERIFAIGFMMICSIQLSYSVNTVGAIIDRISSIDEEKLKKLQIINTWMQNKKISYPLQYQIREYLNYYWQSQSEQQNLQENDIISQLSENLRDNLLMEANSLILNSCSLFQNHFTQTFKNQLLRCLKQIVIQPQNKLEFDKIFPQVNQRERNWICFVEKGDIEMYVENDASMQKFSETTILKTINDGDCFGVEGFLTGKQEKVSYRSHGFSKLILISRDDFIRTLRDFPDDQEEYVYLRDQLLLSGEGIRTYCTSCQSSYHELSACPMFHYIPDRELVIKKLQFSRFQDRNEVQPTRRRDKLAFNSRLDKPIVIEASEWFQKDHEELCLTYEMSVDEQPTHRQTPSIVLVPRVKKEAINEQKPRSQLSILPPLIQENNHPQVPIVKRRRSSQLTLFKPIKKPTIIQPQPAAISMTGSVRLKKVVHVIKACIDIKSDSHPHDEEKEMLHNNLAQLNQRSQRFHYSQGYFKRDIDEAEFLIKRLKMLTNQLEQIVAFETFKSYKHYYPNNNFTHEIRSYDTKNTEILNRYMRYLSFPHDFILKYMKEKRVNESKGPKMLKSLRRRSNTAKFFRRTQIHPKI